MAHRQMEREIPENFRMLINRAKHSIHRGIGIIAKYNLNALQLKANL
jgi:hypothetical protein